jgi:hypothetical protein
MTNKMELSAHGSTTALPGDAILYPANGASSFAARFVLIGELLAGLGDGLEQYSHAAVLDTPGWQYEAYFPKTRRSQIDPKREYEIWRICDLTCEQRTAITEWCKAHVGKWYNLTGVLTLDLIHLPGSYYCSQFLGTAYAEAAGIKLGDRIMSPDSIPDYPGAKMLYRNIP